MRKKKLYEKNMIAQRGETSLAIKMRESRRLVR